MPKVDVPALNLALQLLRIARRKTQEELGELTGMPSQIKEIENGRKTVSRSELEGYARLMEAPAGAVPVALGFAEATMPSADQTAHPWEATAEDRLAAERAFLETGQIIRQVVLAEGRAKRYAADRAEAERLWALLAPQKPDRRRLMAQAKAFRTWALIERLCIESLKEAPRDPEAARSLAELAVEVARRLPPLQGFSDRLEGYAQAHLGNAFRVADDYNSADRSFALVAKLWIEPAPGEVCPLDVAQIPSLEASLRRDQRLFPLALSRLDRAFALAADDPSRGRILLKRGFVLEQAGESMEAVAALRDAVQFGAPSQDPRFHFGVHFNLAVNLLHLERPAEAEPLVSKVRAMAIEQRNDLDLLRVDWLSGRLAAAQGHRTEALTAIDDAARRFAERGLGYNAALAVLDLSVLLLEVGNARETARRVAEMHQAFQVRNIQREELASLVLFLRAVEAEAATAALARAAAEAWRLFGAPVSLGVPHGSD
ncbi:MAG TPA: helix-turn-helix transcriptional regulator [Thermoanaerobaculia bacterium]|nr:helix-turn-helix transcriptional regulator [Thermoanaerobaculia bacterium]